MSVEEFKKWDFYKKKIRNSKLFLWPSDIFKTKFFDYEEISKIVVELKIKLNFHQYTRKSKLLWRF